ncbi:twin-arginine translocation signal domain-containing protein [uncultured Mitsuokella sp.]|nr:twin-arginine translocation signal domain-containing protein [uncultured Mitsuokella sp.]
MNRRDFLKLTGMGAMTIFLSGCGLSAQLKTIVDRF